MTLRAVVLLVAVALVARRFLPNRPMSWTVPLVLGSVIVVVRSVAWVLTSE